jgi:hypothetical protein
MFRRFALVLFVGVPLLLSPGAAESAEPAYTALELAAARERAVYGLDASPATVRAILAAGQDVGTERWGMVMTTTEEAALDMPGRAAFANELAATLVPYLESITISGGLYIDQAAGGRAVVMLTKRDPAIEAELAMIAAGLSRQLSVSYVDYSEAELEVAVARVWQAWPDLKVRPQSVGVDVAANRVFVEVVPEAVAAAQVVLADLTESIGVPVAFRVGEPDPDAACVGRDHCDTPLRAGIRVYRGANPPNNEANCTMGFHITRGTDEQWLTAGHCGYTGSNNWFHPSFGLVGSELATLFVPNGIDAMRVQLADAQATNLIYDRPLRVMSDRQPIQGEGICASLGFQDAWDCGTVSTTHTSWISSTRSCVVWGADADGITIVPGDSGSPIVNNTLSGSYVAIGIVNTMDGRFAKADNVIQSFGASLFVP